MVWTTKEWSRPEFFRFGPQKSGPDQIKWFRPGKTGIFRTIKKPVPAGSDHFSWFKPGKPGPSLVFSGCYGKTVTTKFRNTTCTVYVRRLRSAHARRHSLTLAPFPTDSTPIAPLDSAAISLTVRSRVLVFTLHLWRHRTTALLCAWLCVAHVLLMCSLLCRHHLHHVGQRRRPPPLLHGTDAGIGSRGGAWYGAIRATPSGPAPPREDATRARAGVRVAAARARHAGAGPHAGRGPRARRHGAAASPGGGWGGAREGGGRARRGSS